MRTNVLSILLLVFVLSSCSKKGLQQTEKTSTEGYSLNAALAEYENNTIDFETFALKAKCKYEDEDRNVTFTANFKIKKDEKIWVSATLFGIEGARALITPDSVQMINRIERSYYSESIEKLQEISGLPVDFGMLQNLITGKILLLNEDTSISQTEGKYELATALEGILGIAFINDASFLMSNQNVKDEALNSEMNIEYSEYGKVDQYDYPFQTNIYVTGEKEITLDLSISSVELNEKQSYSFSINKNYDRKEL